MEAVFAGVAVLHFHASESPPPAKPQIQAFLNQPFVNLRILPDDDALLSRYEKPQFEDIYREVLRYYHILYPGMDQVFAFFDPLTISAFARRILERTDPKITPQQSPLYMPVTREMSYGKRKLLHRYLESLIAEQGPDQDLH